MADPATMTLASAGVGMASSLIGSVFGAEGASQQGAAQAAAYRYKAGVAAINEKVQEQNSQWALASGDVASEEAGLKAGQEIGETRAKQGASGTDVNSGSNTLVRDSQRTAAQFDQSVVTNDAARKSYAFRVAGTEASAEQNLDTMAATSTDAATGFQVASSILGGASSVASKWMQASSVGLGQGNAPGKIGLFDPSNFGAAPKWVDASAVEI